jgi:hypothetical protein
MRTIGNNAIVKLEEKDSGSYTNHIGTKFQLPTPYPWHKDIDCLAVPKAQSFERFDRFEWICFIASPVSANTHPAISKESISFFFARDSRVVPNNNNNNNNIFSKYQTQLRHSMISQLFLASLVSCEIWERANPIHQYLDTRSTFIGGISLYALTPSDNAGTCPTYTQTCSGSCCPDGCCPFGTYCFVNGDYCCPNGIPPSTFRLKIQRRQH